MNCTRFWLAMLGLSLGSLARADDQALLRGWVDKAVQAHGGAANLNKFSAATWQGTAHFYWTGTETVHAMSGARQHGNQGLVVVENEINGKRFRMTRTINGSQGWMKADDQVQDLDPALLAEEKERLYASWIATLAPLTNWSYPLASADVIQVFKRPAIGVRVSSPGHRDIILYFDQETHLLVKKATWVRDLSQGGKNLVQETFFSDYRPVEGVKIAHKQEVYWNGKRYLGMEWNEFKLLPKLPDPTFLRPQ